MPRYLKYPILVFFIGAVVYFTANVVQAISTPSDTSVDVQAPSAQYRAAEQHAPTPNYLITDAGMQPPK